MEGDSVHMRHTASFQVEMVSPYCRWRNDTDTQAIQRVKVRHVDSGAFRSFRRRSRAQQEVRVGLIARNTDEVHIQDRAPVSNTSCGRGNVDEARVDVTAPVG